MYLRIYSILCYAVLIGFAAAIQNNPQHNSDIGFNDDAGIEGSGNDGEVTHDLESSGSGFGPDDEDTPIEPHITPRVKNNLDTRKPSETVPTNTLDTPEVRNPPHETNINNNINNNNNINPSDEETEVKSMDPRTSFFAQPGILAAVIGGAVVGLLCAILVVMFIVYRMRKKDEGSYSLGEPKPSPNANTYNRDGRQETMKRKNQTRKAYKYEF
ncbi:syndecan [Harmonia axyridis]|uniref:syndecan n=1 Tax=Harmonia axyridis TaxID=115357 RepID=UPI001E275ABD|nr:syndecan [Harmonia axyridis]